MIRKRRSEKSATQETIAADAGLHRTYVTDMERGKRNPSLFILFRLSTALNLTLTEFCHLIEREVARISK